MFNKYICKQNFTSMSRTKQKAVIELEKMEFYAFHGCYKEEQRVGNKFIVNISIETNISTARISDNIQDTINYVKIYNAVKDEMKQNSHLLEHVAGRIIDRLLHDFPQILHITVKISKMNPPIGGQMKAFSLTLSQ